MQRPTTRSASGGDSRSEGSRLEVRRLVDSDSAARLLRREPVNPVDEADDPAAFDRALRDRTDVDRRVYELVDPETPGHPRTVVWVALTAGVPLSLDELTDDRPPLEPAAANTAVFWSIWNVDAETSARSGGPAGRELIEGAVASLQVELRALRTFVTLSPVPGLRRWIDETRQAVDPSDDPALRRVAAEYLTTLGEDRRPLDPVARFHLGNGARLWQINAGADRSARGLERSYGVMANYLYEPEDRSANRKLLRNGTVAASGEVEALLDRPTG